MAVGASHVAFVNLGLQLLDSRSTYYQDTDAEVLVASNMVELQHHRIAFAAVDARMREQV